MLLNYEQNKYRSNGPVIWTTYIGADEVGQLKTDKAREAMAGKLALIALNDRANVLSRTSTEVETDDAGSYRREAYCAMRRSFASQALRSAYSSLSPIFVIVVTPTTVTSP